MTLTTPEPAIERDRYSRPMVLRVEDNKKVAYTRCTTYIKVIEDTFNLQKWMMRQVAIGLSQREDLRLSALAHLGDKRELDKICETAKEVAGATKAATTGTALHALTELVDRGQDLPPGLSPSTLASLEKYQAATKDLKSLHIERFCVQDAFQIGGTPDRIVKYGKGTYIADIKTGSIEWAALTIAMQLWVYSTSHLYDVRTGARSDHGADRDRGLIIHLPAVEGPADASCTLHWIDLRAGAAAVLTARDVREHRKLKFPALTTPFETDLVPDLTASVKAQITACTDADAVRALWREDWSVDLTDFAAAHVATLTGNPAA